MNYTETTERKAWHKRSPLCLIVNIWLILILVGTAAAATPKLCFTQVTGLPKSDGHGGFTFPDNPPNLTILNDPNNHPVDPDLDTGWFNAFRLPFQNGTPVGDGVMQAIAQQNGPNQMLYFSFKVTNDLDADISDAVVLGFSSLPPENQNNPQTYTWVVIQPLALGAPGQPQSVPGNLIKFWKGTNQGGTVVWDNNFSTAPTWLTAVEASSGNGPFSWYVTVRVDNSDPNGPGLPLTGNFGVLLDTVVTQAFTNMGNMDEQYIFPSALGSLDDTLNADAGVNPAPTQWADATFDTNCSGVHFSWGDITNTVNGSLTSRISWTQTNNFGVKVHNSGALAPQVRATFKIANFGLPAPQEWAPLGTLPNNDNVTPNPTNPVDIPAHGLPPGSCGDNSGDGCATINAPPWTLGAGNVAYYSQPDNQHECVRVDLDSLSGTNPTFVNSSSWNNFDFAATASKFVSPSAFVSGKYPPAKGAAPGATQVIDLFVTVQKVNPGQAAAGSPNVPGAAAATRGQPAAASKGDGGDRITSVAILIVHACRHTGKFVTIDPAQGSPGNPKSQKFENCEPIGAYGYGITHVGTTAVTNWNYSLSGAGLTHLGSGVYRLNVPQDGVAKVVTTVEPEYPGEDKVAIYIDLGAAIPNGTPFSTVFNTGFSLNAGLEYMFTNRLSAEGIFGYHHFPANGGGSLEVYQFSADAKAYLLTGTLRPFVNGGIGGYHLGAIGTDFGGNFGAGILKEFNLHWGLQGSYNFHAVNTPGTSTKFSTVQGGIRYVF